MLLQSHLWPIEFVFIVKRTYLKYPVSTKGKQPNDAFTDTLHILTLAVLMYSYILYITLCLCISADQHRCLEIYLVNNGTK